MKKLLFCLLLFTFNLSFFTSSAQNTWTQQADFGGGARDVATGFSIGNYGYILTGMDSGYYYSDVWRYSPNSNTWLQVDSFPGGSRIGTQAVSMHSYGYVLGGEVVSGCFSSIKGSHGAVCGATYYADLWRYNPDSNTWIQLAALPGSGRDLGVAVADPDNNTIYYGTGNDNDSAYMTDWWGYDAVHNVWNQLANFPGGQRCCAVGFYLNGNIYVGTGNNGDNVNNASNDFWEYSPVNNNWTRVANVPGNPRRSATAFTISGYGYVTLGLNDTTYSSDAWRYNPVTNSWQAVAGFGGSVMTNGVGFTIHGNGYVGTGSYDNLPYSQFWEYTPDILGINNLSNNENTIVYPNPCNGMFSVQCKVVSGQAEMLNGAETSIEVFNILGEKIYSQPNITNSTFNINLSAQPDGVYFYRVLNAGKVANTGKLVIQH